MNFAIPKFGKEVVGWERADSDDFEKALRRDPCRTDSQRGMGW